MTATSFFSICVWLPKLIFFLAFVGLPSIFLSFLIHNQTVKNSKLKIISVLTIEGIYNASPASLRKWAAATQFQLQVYGKGKRPCKNTHKESRTGSETEIYRNTNQWTNLYIHKASQALCFIIPMIQSKTALVQAVKQISHIHLHCSLSKCYQIDVYDENQQASLKDPLHVLVGPITRARSKIINEALSGLIQEIWDRKSVV